MTVFQVKVFTKNPVYGNLAGVVIDDKLTHVKRQAVARAVGVSETAFVSRSKRADFFIRWFTPNQEVGFCVHATIAAIAIYRKIYKNNKKNIKVESKNGILTAKINKDEIFIKLPPYALVKKAFSYILLSRHLGIKLDDIAGKPKIFKVFKDKEIVIPVKGLDVLARLKPKKSAYAALCRKIRCTGISVFTQETINPKSSLHTREFASLYGYLEDPLCGLAAGAIAHFLRLGSNKKLIVEQGNFIKCPGIIKVENVSSQFYLGGTHVIKASRDLPI